MVGREGGRMVARLHEKLQKARVAPGIMRRFAEHGEKQLGRHELAAGARDKKAAGLDQLHAAQVQLLIAAVGVIERFAAFGKGGRIADDETEAPLLVGPCLREVEDVFTDGGDFFFDAVQSSVAADERERLLGDVDGGDMLRAVERGVDRKAAGAAAQIQNGSAGAIGADASAVFLLVEEVTGFLPVRDADEHTRVMLADFNLIRNAAIDAGFDLGKSFFFADGKIVTLVDAEGMEEVRKNVYEALLPRLQTETGDLKAEIACEFIDRESGKTVRFSKDDAAGIGKAELRSCAPCRFDAGTEKVLGNSFGWVARQDADGDFGAGIEKAAGGKAQMLVQYVDDAAVGAGVVCPVQLVVEDQGLTGADVGGFAAAEAYIRIGHEILL